MHLNKRKRLVLGLSPRGGRLDWPPSRLDCRPEKKVKKAPGPHLRRMRIQRIFFRRFSFFRPNLFASSFVLMGRQPCEIPVILHGCALLTARAHLLCPIDFAIYKNFSIFHILQITPLAVEQKTLILRFWHFRSWILQLNSAMPMPRATGFFAPAIQKQNVRSRGSEGKKKGPWQQLPRA